MGKRYTNAAGFILDGNKVLLSAEVADRLNEMAKRIAELEAELQLEQDEARIAKERGDLGL